MLFILHFYFTISFWIVQSKLFIFKILFKISENKLFYRHWYNLTVFYKLWTVLAILTNASFLSPPLSIYRERKHNRPCAITENCVSSSIRGNSISRCRLSCEDRVRDSCQDKRKEGGRKKRKQQDTVFGYVRVSPCEGKLFSHVSIPKTTFRKVKSFCISTKKFEWFSFFFFIYMYIYIKVRIRKNLFKLKNRKKKKITAEIEKQRE